MTYEEFCEEKQDVPVRLPDPAWCDAHEGYAYDVEERRDLPGAPQLCALCDSYARETLAEALEAPAPTPCRCCGATEPCECDGTECDLCLECSAHCVCENCACARRAREQEEGRDAD